MSLLLLWQIAPVFHKLVIKVGTKEESLMVYNFISVAWVSGLKMFSPLSPEEGCNSRYPVSGWSCSLIGFKTGEK